MYTLNRLANLFFEAEMLNLITKTLTITFLAIFFFSCTAPITHEEIKTEVSKLQVVAQKKKVAEKDVAEARKLMEEAKQLVVILQEKQQREPVEKAEIEKAKRVAKQVEKIAQSIQEKFKKQANQSSKKQKSYQTGPSTKGTTLDAKKSQMPFGISVDALPKNFDSKYFKKMRIQQIQLCKITSDFDKKMGVDFSQGRKLGLDSYKKQLTNDVDGLLPFGKLDNWIVKVVDVEQQSNEKILIRFMLQCSANFVGTVNSSDLFLKGLKRGDIALVSGNIIFPPTLQSSSAGRLSLKEFPFSFERTFNLSKD